MIRPLPLQYLFEAVRQGTVRAAADYLGIAPSAISRQIAKLEQELGVSVIERHRRGVLPTQAGEILLRHYRQQQAQQEALDAQLAALRGLASGHLSLAVGEGFIGDLLAEALRAFRQDFPRLTLDIHIAGTDEVARRVLDDEAHLGLLYHAPPEPKLRVLAHAKHPVCAIVSPAHPLATRAAPLSFSDLQSTPLALMTGAYGLRHLLDQAERSENSKLQATVSSNAIATLKNFALTVQGAALLPAFVVAVEANAGSLCALPVDQPLFQSGETRLVTRLGRELVPGAQQLQQYVRRYMQAFQ